MFVGTLIPVHIVTHLEHDGTQEHLQHSLIELLVHFESESLHTDRRTWCVRLHTILNTPRK